MKTDSSKKWNSAAKAYADMAADRQADAYEYEINFPSILNLLPKDKNSLLDVGTGSGDFIPNLAKYFENIEGTDVSPNMVEIAKKRFSDYKFMVWDLEDKFPDDGKYDVIVCKLVLMFVENLDNVAKEFKKILNHKGVAVISVVHPVYWHTNYLLNKNSIKISTEFDVMDEGYYSSGKKVMKSIGGNENLQMGFIHRTLSDYFKPFIDNGLTITGIDEPRINDEFLKSNPRFADRINIPMRLNFRVENFD